MIRSRSLAAVVAMIASIALTSPASAKRHQSNSPTDYNTMLPGERMFASHHIEYGEVHQRKVARKSSRKSAKHQKRERHDTVTDANGNRGDGIVVSHKTGARAHVAPRYAAMFQAYVDALEDEGATIYYMGGYRPGRCSDGHQHPCGKALDVCQDYRNHVSGERDCHLPGPRIMAQVARSVGLYEGGVWCQSPDYGHAQVTPTGSVCPAKGMAGAAKTYATITGELLTTEESEARAAQRYQRHYAMRERVRYTHRRHHHQYASR